VPGIPAYVDALVARATARDRGQRPADAAVLLHQLHRVAHALAEGVRDDPDLTADLTPILLPPDATTAPTAPRPGDTAADPWDADEMAALLGPGPVADGRTTALPTFEPPPAPDRERPTQPPAPPRPVEHAPRRPRRRRRGVVLLVLALLIAVAAGTGAWWFGYARYSATPSVIGLTQAAATTKLEDAGLDVKVGESEYSETVAAGKVISTDPDPGSRILDGGTVTLTVSLGKERYDVPRLHGLTVDEAKQKLRELHLTPGTLVERYDETVPEGQVIRSSPTVGKSLRPGTAVDLVVSQGPRPIKVGSWVGKDVDEATQVLEDRGLHVEASQEEYSDTVPAGSIISQAPRGGTLFRGETVTFVVSKGPELVEMPNVLAHGVDSATQELQGLGFQVQVRNSAGYLGLGYVYSTDPDAGEMLPKGSTVTLYLV
jgi:serine/threonine-protein kinase